MNKIPKSEIVFQFTQPEIISQDVSRFLNAYGYTKLPEGDTLRSMEGSLIIIVDGYDNDQRSLPEIPEVRGCFRKLYSEFPYWFYFLLPETLPTMALCLFEKYSGVRSDKSSMTMHGFMVPEMAKFVRDQARPLQEMCFRAGMSLNEFDKIYYERSLRLMPDLADSVPPP